MFFVGLFGVNSKEKRLKINVNGFECHTKHCHGRGTLVRYYHHFHVFFIPIFKWGEEYYVMCDTCEAVYKITKEQGKLVEQQKLTLTYWDLQVVREGHLKYKCPNCGFSLDETYAYCPKCGLKV